MAFRTVGSMKRTRIPSLFLILFALVGLLTACGGDDEESSEFHVAGQHQRSPPNWPRHAQRLGRHLPQGLLRGGHRRVHREALRRHDQLRRRRLGQGPHRPRRPGRRLRRHRRPGQGRGRGEVQGRPFLYFPTVAAPITVSYNLTASTSCSYRPTRSPRSSSARSRRGTTRRSPPTTPAPRCRQRPSSWPTAPTARARPRTSPSSSRPPRPTAWKLDAGSTVEWPADTQAGKEHRRRPDRQGAPTAPSATSTSPTPRRPAEVRHDQEQGRQVRRADASTAPAPRWPASTVKPDLSYNPL